MAITVHLLNCICWYLTAYVKVDSNNMLWESFDRPSLIFQKFRKSYTLERIYEKYDFWNQSLSLLIFLKPLFLLLLVLISCVSAEIISINVALLFELAFGRDRKSTRLNSSHMSISYAV